MTLGKRFKRIVAGAALLTAALTGSGQVSARAPHGPALWKVADADTTIYLFGTIHTLPDNTQWEAPPIAKAVNQSDTLVLELLMDDPARMIQIMQRLGYASGLPPLAARVPPEKRATLQKMIAASGISPTYFDQLKSWSAAVVLIDLSLIQAGFRPDQGLEKQLTAIYKQAGKPILGLETAEQQFGFFNNLPEEAQRALLVSAIEDPGQTKEELRGMLDAWLSGNTDAIAVSFDKEMVAAPALRQTILIQRNQAWSNWIADRLDKPGTVFIAVGAGHLAGSDSLQQMLKARGIRAQRVN